MPTHITVVIYSQVWGAVHTWQIQNKEGNWVRMVEELGQTGEEDTRALFDEFLTALATYVRQQRPFVDHIFAACYHEGRPHFDVFLRPRSL